MLYFFVADSSCNCLFVVLMTQKGENCYFEYEKIEVDHPKWIFFDNKDLNKGQTTRGRLVQWKNTRFLKFRSERPWFETRRTPKILFRWDK